MQFSQLNTHTRELHTVQAHTSVDLICLKQSEGMCINCFRLTSPHQCNMPQIQRHSHTIQLDPFSRLSISVHWQFREQSANIFYYHILYISFWDTSCSNAKVYTQTPVLTCGMHIHNSPICTCVYSDHCKGISQLLHVLQNGHTKLCMVSRLE